MNRWFRHYAGMMRDEKLVAVAVKAKQPVERVLWVWGAILESAAEINDNGKYELDCGEVSYFLRADLADIETIVDGLRVSARIDNGFVLKWSDRQYQSDTSAARQAAYRERKRAISVGNDAEKVTSDGGVTSRDGEVTPQETETETDTEKKKDKPNGLSKKGCRLPDDWNPSEADLTAANDTIGYFRTAQELMKFRDYWVSIPGQKGVRLDWDATWRNWIRKAAEQQPRGQPPPKPKSVAELAWELAKGFDSEQSGENGTERPMALEARSNSG